MAETREGLPLVEDLRRKDLSAEQIVQVWSSRRQRMANRRAYFEPLWRSGIKRFFEGILSEQQNGTSPLYNTMYEQYDQSIFSRDGIRFTDIKYPLLHAITLRAMASEIPNRPKVSFVAVGSNDPNKAVGFKHLFNQNLYEMDADAEDFEIFLDKRIFGTSMVMVITEGYEVNVEDPVYNNETGEYDYTSKTKQIKQCLYKKLDIRHVFLDEHCTKSNLSDCRYAQIDEYYEVGDFLMRFGKYPEAMKASMTEMQADEVFENWYDPKGVQYVRVTHCFDKIADRYHIIANNILLNKVNNPIPRKAGRRGKDIPIAIATQYKIPNAPYGYGDSHVTNTFNQVKNLVRRMILEITQKSAKPLLAVDPLSNFDEQMFEWGQDFIRVSPNDLQPIPINPNLQFLYDLDETTDNDIIRSTGININDTTNADTDETARKTVIRRESQNAIIELSMNYLTTSFYKRLYTLLKDDIILHYESALMSGEKVQVKTEGVKLVRQKKGLREIQVKGFRYFDLKPTDLDFDMDLDLEVGNIATSKELEKALAAEALEVIANMPPDLFNGEALAKWTAKTFSMPDDIVSDSKVVSNKTPEEVANEGIPPELLPDSQKVEQEMLAQQEQEATQILSNQELNEEGQLPPLPAMEQSGQTGAGQVRQ